MAKNLKELRDLRGKAVTDARALVDKADEAKRPMTEDEQRQYNAYMNDAARFKSEIEVEERLQDEERQLATDALKNNNGDKREAVTPDVEKRTAAFRKFLLEGQQFMTADEVRAMTSGNDASGGFLNAPQEFVQQLIVSLKNKVFIRDIATIVPLTNAESCGAPSLETDIGDADWTAEIKAVAEDANMAFGKRELKPHMLSKLVKISNKLLRVAAMNPETIALDRMSYKFGVAMEKAYMVGNGAQQPLGVFTASNDGISTARDISEGNAATSISADGLIATKYALKAGYMEKAKWIFHRDAVKQLAQLKDGDGKYIFDLADKPGVPDMLLGRPMLMSEYAPNTFTSGLYVGIFGDFSYYWIADNMALTIQRLNELFSLSNQTGFIGRLETDGMPVLGEAFARVKLG